MPWNWSTASLKHSSQCFNNTTMHLDQTRSKTQPNCLEIKSVLLCSTVSLYQLYKFHDFYLFQQFSSEEFADNDQEKAENMSFVIFLCLAGCIIPHLVFSANQSVSFTLKLSQTKFGTIICKKLSLFCRLIGRSRVQPSFLAEARGPERVEKSCLWQTLPRHTRILNAQLTP